MVIQGISHGSICLNDSFRDEDMAFFLQTSSPRKTKHVYATKKQLMALKSLILIQIYPQESMCNWKSQPS